MTDTPTPTPTPAPAAEESPDTAAALRVYQLALDTALAEWPLVEAEANRVNGRLRALRYAINGLAQRLGVKLDPEEPYSFDWHAPSQRTVHGQPPPRGPRPGRRP